MLIEPVEAAAERVWRHLNNQNAVRRPEEDQARNFVTVGELCEEFHIDRVLDWPKLRDWMITHGYPIAFSSRGYYAGPAGDEVTLDFRRLRQVVSAERRGPAIRRRLRQVQENGGEAWQHLQRRYGVQDVTELEAERLRRYKLGDASPDDAT